MFSAKVRVYFPAVEGINIRGMSAKCCVCLLPSYWLSNSQSVRRLKGKQRARPTGDPDTLFAFSSFFPAFANSSHKIVRRWWRRERRRGGEQPRTQHQTIDKVRFASLKSSGPSGLRLVPQQCNDYSARGRVSSNSGKAAGGKS
jgi:hypothetical protein